jgi:4-amino-4-deoxy-L-arabinose transferase-like glycosyltransferase
MPGYPLALAISYWFFGYGTIESQFPNMVAYIVSCLLVFQLTKEHFGRKAAWFSAFLFILFPLNLYFPFIVMLEMFFVAVSLLAFYIFTHLKEGQRWFLGPWLVAVPFLVRETGALLVVPMALYIIWPDIRRHWKETTAFIAATILLLVALYLSPVASGRISLFYNFAGLPLYDDIAKSSFSLTILEMVRLLFHRIITNIFLLSNELKLEDILYLSLVLISIPVSFVNARFDKKNYRFAIATVGFVITSFAVLFTFYEITSFRGVRSMMFTMPYAIIMIGAMLSYLADRLPQKLKFVPLAVELLLLVVFVGQNLYVLDVYNNSMREENFEEASVPFIVSLSHDDQRVLVAPLHLAVNYTKNHFPVKLAFVPVSKRGFEALISKYDVGTIVLPIYIERDQVSVEDLESMGFRLESVKVFSQTKYYILKNREN